MHRDLGKYYDKSAVKTFTFPGVNCDRCVKWYPSGGSIWDVSSSKVAGVVQQHKELAGESLDLETLVEALKVGHWTFWLCERVDVFEPLDSGKSIDHSKAVGKLNFQGTWWGAKKWTRKQKLCQEKLILAKFINCK